MDTAKELERVEYSEDQKCFHTCDVLDIIPYPEGTTFSLLGIVSTEMAMEFTDGIFALFEGEIEGFTYTDMEFLFGVYMLNKHGQTKHTIKSAHDQIKAAKKRP